MKAAVWWLDRFRVDPSLAGDLLEAYRAGRSRFWLTRQVVIAAVMATLNDIKSRKAVVASSLAAGAASLFVFGGIAFVLQNSLGHAVAIGVGNWLLTHSYNAARWWWFLGMTGSLPNTMIAWAGLIAVGWVLVRIDAEKRLTGLILLVVFIIVASLPNNILLVAELFSGHGRPSEVVLVKLATHLLAYAAIVIGSLWADGNARGTVQRHPC